jgi:putative ATP-dependent endonuclease of OLD family
MKLKRFSVQNVRSFMERETLEIDGDISILIGPNGGGKTNLLDAVVVLLRRYLFASRFPAHVPTPENQNRWEFRPNDALNQLNLERHVLAPSGLDQVLEAQIEVTAPDIQNIAAMKRDAPHLGTLAAAKYVNVEYQNISQWDPSALAAGQLITYRLVNGNLTHDNSAASLAFLRYLQFFEVDSMLREEYEVSTLSTPMVYLPTNRTSSGFQSSIQLANFNPYDHKRQTDAVYSRSNPSLIPLAVGRLAQKYRLLLEKDRGRAREEFYNDPNIRELGQLLHELGYKWTLESMNPLRNEYDVKLQKQGSSFLVSAASSGERELLTYLFAIFALNVRDALIVVDEPELHLHPQWQQTLLVLFTRLAVKTGNQFLLATHSPTFVAPQSIQYVSRVYSESQKSRLVRLNSTALPDERHLFNIVNSQNNERIFFSDRVVLVEGLSDRIVVERVLDLHGRAQPGRSNVEVVAVGGKGLFDAYAAMLNACRIPFAVIADQDYLEQIGSNEIKQLFVVNAREIKQDVIENFKSTDGDALVAAIDSAVADGDWGDAKGIWEYIKSKRRELKGSMSAKETGELTGYIGKLRERRIFVLKRGALERYLPEGYRSKDLSKLIRLVRSPGFWESLEPDSQAELKEIAEAVLA